MTDFEITQSIRNNNHAGIKYLYEKNYIGLCTYALRFTKSKVTAEEMVQTAFLKLWENREKIEIRESYTAYLFRAVRNHCLNYLKHQQIIHKYNENLVKSYAEIEETLTLSYETGLSIYLAKELETKIARAIESLPEQFASPFQYEIKHDIIFINQ